MEAFQIQTIKSEKAMAMRRYCRIRKIATFFRFLEACLVLFLLSWFSSRIPTAARNSGGFFRKLCAFLVSPRFVFFVGNAIVVVLVVKSGQSPADSPSVRNLCEDFLRSNESDQAAIAGRRRSRCGKGKAYRRSASEGGVCARKQRELRRAETDIGRGVDGSGDAAAELSDEEFRRAVEEFIARQLKFQREESMAIVFDGRDLI